MSDLESPAAAEAKLPPGPKYTYKLLDSQRQLDSDPHSVTLVLVLLAQQQEAEKAAEAKGTAPIWEIIKYGLVAVDGKALGWEAAAKETLLERLSPKARGAVATAFTALHANTEAETKAFLAPANVTVTD